MLYDHDGTLIDSLAAVVAATNQTLAARGLPACTRDQVVAGMVLPTAPRMGLHAGIADEAERARLAAAFYAAFRASPPGLAPPYPGVDRVCAAVAGSGRPQGVISNNEGRSVRALLTAAGIIGHFRFAWGEEDVPATKPDPRGLLQAAAHLDLPPADCVYVGDSPVDARAAAAAGMGCILVGWGTHRADELAGAGCLVAADPDALIALLA